jgi:hypothetical protein
VSQRPGQHQLRLSCAWSTSKTGRTPVFRPPRFPSGKAAGPRGTSEITVSASALLLRQIRVPASAVSAVWFCTGSSAGTFTIWHPDLDWHWWQIAELVMENQAEHGTCVLIVTHFPDLLRCTA